MPAQPLEIKYVVRCPEADMREIVFQVLLDGDTLAEIREDPAKPPWWASLEIAQCGVCPLDKQHHLHCPAALALVELVDEFAGLLSYSRVEAVVTMGDRTVSIQTTVQRALSSLIGLRLATCGCPVLAKLKPMARFHLPFATREETIFRAAGSYLLAQYYLRQHGKVADLELRGLSDMYDQIHSVNVRLAARIRGLAGGDANVNALVLLDLFAQDLPYSVNENMRTFEGMFAPYFE